MGYYVSNIIGIRTGGVFSGKIDIKDVRERISKIILEMREEESKIYATHKIPCPKCGGKEIHTFYETVLGNMVNYEWQEVCDVPHENESYKCQTCKHKWPRDKYDPTIREQLDAAKPPDLGDKSGNSRHCMSRELVAHKGSYVVLAGVFNHWKYPNVCEFAKRLSKEFGTEILVMSWDEEANTIQVNIFLAGKPLFEVCENPIGQIIRRVT